MVYKHYWFRFSWKCKRCSAFTKQNQLKTLKIGSESAREELGTYMPRDDLKVSQKNLPENSCQMSFENTYFDMFDHADMNWKNIPLSGLDSALATVTVKYRYI